jgi:chromosome segregation ATPase
LDGQKGVKEETMKKALSLALITALSLLLFLPAMVCAQEESEGEVEAVPELLKQELATMEAVFGGMQSFMSELVTEVKDSMAEIEAINQVLVELTTDLRAAEKRVDDLSVRVTQIDKGLNEVVLELTADLRAAEKRVDDLSIRVEKLESEELGTFKNKVLELERSISALSIKIDNNRNKLDGFDQAIADLSVKTQDNTDGILGNMALLEDHEARISALEDGTMLSDLQSQVSSLYVIALLALLAGAGALIWSFVGS